MRRGLSGTALQALAILSMTLDHIGAITLRERRIAWADVLHEMPMLFVLRAVGRAAFPIFAFLLAQGMLHTRSRGRFMLRLAVFALLSELPLDLAFYGVAYYPDHQNVFFTLFLGAACIALCDGKGTALGAAAIFATALTAQLLRTDYAALGVLTIMLFWRLSSKGALGITAVLLLFTGSCLIYDPLIYLFCLLALPLLLCYNGKRGGPTGRVGAAVRKWGFYLYYPAHLLALTALAGYYSSIV